MLPVVDPDGESIARRVVICSLLLIPISLVPLFLGMTGALYAAAAIIGGLGLLYFRANAPRENLAQRAGAAVGNRLLSAGFAPYDSVGPTRCLKHRITLDGSSCKDSPVPQSIRARIKLLAPHFGLCRELC